MAHLGQLILFAQLVSRLPSFASGALCTAIQPKLDHYVTLAHDAIRKAHLSKASAVNSALLCSSLEGPFCNVGTCTDSTPNCADWARKGLCQKNPETMLVGCKVSCNVCGSKPPVAADGARLELSDGFGIMKISTMDGGTEEDPLATVYEMQDFKSSSDMDLAVSEMSAERELYESESAMQEALGGSESDEAFIEEEAAEEKSEEEIQDELNEHESSLLQDEDQNGGNDEVYEAPEMPGEDEPSEPESGDAESSEDESSEDDDVSGGLPYDEHEGYDYTGGDSSEDVVDEASDNSAFTDGDTAENTAYGLDDTAKERSASEEL